MQPNPTRAAPAIAGNGSQKDRLGSAINQTDKPKPWRDQYAVHPAADVFPMMSDDELAKLGEDIKANGLKVPLSFFVGDKDAKSEPILLDGRNRLEAMDRVGFTGYVEKRYIYKDPVAYVISLNVRRRHLTKEQQADLIVAAHKANKPRQLGEVSRGGRGKLDEVKAAAVSTAEELGIGKRTVERSLAKAEGRKPTPPAPAPVLDDQQSAVVELVSLLRDNLKTTVPQLDDLMRSSLFFQLRFAIEEWEGQSQVVADVAQEQIESNENGYPELPAFLDRRKTR